MGGFLKENKKTPIGIYALYNKNDYATETILLGKAFQDFFSFLHFSFFVGDVAFVSTTYSPRCEFVTQLLLHKFGSTGYI